MKTFYEKIPLDDSRTFIAREFLVDELTYPLHHHPYFEINYILSGSGERIVGQQITEFSDNDLTLIGPNLPHQFKSAKKEISLGGRVHSIIVQFHPKIFGDVFFEREETAAINTLLERAQRGVVFGNETKEKSRLILTELVGQKSFEGVLSFLDLLNMLAGADDYQFLSDIQWEEKVSGKGQERTDKLFQHIFANYTNELKMETLARLAGISKSAFSHYFKKRTGKTFSVFLNELRISHAIRLLRETEKNIAEVCYESGFNNLAYFNRTFKKINALTPREYRNNMCV